MCVSQEGELAVEKVVIVIASGHVINTHNAAEQLEGGVCCELSHAWMGGLEMKEGRFVNTNFDSFGAPAGPPVPPAVANAIFHATGKRIRSTPFNDHDISWS